MRFSWLMDTFSIPLGSIQMTHSAVNNDKQIAFYKSSHMTPGTRAFSAFLMDIFNILLPEQSEWLIVPLLMISSVSLSIFMKRYRHIAIIIGTPGLRDRSRRGISNETITHDELTKCVCLWYHAIFFVKRYLNNVSSSRWFRKVLAEVCVICP